MEAPIAQMVKKSACNALDLVKSPGLEDSLEKGMAAHSSIVSWQITRT